MTPKKFDRFRLLAVCAARGAITPNEVGELRTLTHQGYTDLETATDALNQIADWHNIDESMMGTDPSHEALKARAALRKIGIKKP